MDLSDSWGFFDQIYCISLDVRGDRRSQASRQFAGVGLLDRVEFVIVPRHLEDRAKGIFESHRFCLQKGLAQGARRILIFEDDVMFENFDPHALREACAQLEKAGHWDSFFLGCITKGSRKTAAPSLVAIKYHCLAHGYALNAPFARELVREQWQGIPFDELLRRRGVEVFALHPMCAFQGRFGTDNQTVAIDRLRRLFGGLAFIQQVNEFYQNHKVLCLAVHLTAFLALGLLACKLW